MNYYQLPVAVERADDDPVMTDAIRALMIAGIDVRRPDKTSYQLKVSESISYYPAKGTIYIDGTAGALPQRGLEAILTLLADQPCEQPLGIH